MGVSNPRESCVNFQQEYILKLNESKPCDGRLKILKNYGKWICSNQVCFLRNSSRETSTLILQHRTGKHLRTMKISLSQFQ